MDGKRTLIGLNLSVFIMMLGVGMIMALLPNKVIELTGSSSSVGYIASAYALSCIALQVPIGNLSDRFGFKLFLVTGYVLCAVTGLLYYFSNSAGFIFLGRIIQGAGEAPIWAMAPALLSIKFPDSKGKVMGIYNATMHIGLTIGPMLGILFLKYWADNLAFLFYTAVCLIGAVVIYFSVENAEGNRAVDKETISIRNILALTSNRTILITFAGIALYGAGYGLLLTVIPAFLLTVKSFSQTAVQVYFSLCYIAISLSQIITGPLSDKMGRERFMVIGLVIAALSIGIFPGLRQPWISMGLAFLSLGLGIFFLASMAFLNSAVPNSLKGTISGAYYLFWGAGLLVGPVLVGKIGRLLPGSSAGFYVFSLALVIEAITMMFLYRKAKLNLPAVSQTN